MAPAEVTVKCPGCGSSARVPASALRRDNSYCSFCGKRIPLGDVHYNADLPAGTGGFASRPRRTYRSARRH